MTSGAISAANEGQRQVYKLCTRPALPTFTLKF